MPVQMSRSTRPLLFTVGGKQHATNDDHIEQLPTPPGTNNSSRSFFTTPHVLDEDDITRSPESSEDEATMKRLINGSSTFRTPRQIDGVEVGTQKLSAFKKPTSGGLDNGKRPSAIASDPWSSDNDKMIFESSGSQKRRKKSAGPANFHAPRPVKQYGSRQIRKPQKADKSTGFRRPRKMEAKREETKPAPPQFKRAVGADMFGFGREEDESESKTPANRGEDAAEVMDLTSPSLSSLSPPPQSPGVEEVAMLDLTAPQPYIAKVECPICNERVVKSLKEEFQIQFTGGTEILNYKWQQRFCRWHKKQDAIRLRGEKGYPEVDWDRLERRMRRQHQYLRDVISCERRSYYRDQLSEKLRDGSKTAMQAIRVAGGKREVSVGYYGPRGERLMTEHIVSHLSDHIRQQSTKDRLVAAVGVSGGVSGFVQAVLVPELAEQLVKEDMRVPDSKARRIIVESAELGELLYPDANDEVAVERFSDVGE